MKKDLAEHSKFWLGEGFDEANINQMDLYRLASFRRSISNFVTILTGETIPVKFTEKADSFTDGKTVHIGGEITKGQFDSTVGLALHEGSHVIKSDFDLVKNLWGTIPNRLYAAGKDKLSKNSIANLTKVMHNYVEDKYIDAWAFKAAPGYRGYYRALYDKYFNDDKITLALLSKSYRKKTLKNYSFRVINITNPNSPLDALPGLRKIHELLNLDNILRLETPPERLELAYDIVEIILTEVLKEEEKPKTKKGQNQEAQSSGDDCGEQSGEKNEQPSDEQPETGDSKEESKEEPNIDDVLGGSTGDEDEKSEPTSVDGEAEEPTEELSEKQIEQIEKAIEQQENFTNRELKKSGLSEALIKRLDVIEKSSTQIVEVGGEEGVPKVECVLVNKMDKSIMEDESFPFCSKLSVSKNLHQDAVVAGVALGTLLGRRLQIRNDSKTTKFSRLPRGKIEKRLLAELGYGSSQIFYQSSVDQYKKAHVHISVDASGSMARKWKKTLTTVVALAKAASMVRNLGVTITFRAGSGVLSTTPYIVVAYDSRHDSFSKVTQLFPALIPDGSTPEGLTFQAILGLIPKSGPDFDSFFVNLSDGVPEFSEGYHGATAQNHTKLQVEKMRAAGITVISYFLEAVEDKRDIKLTEFRGNSMIAFKKMYGRDALFIDVDNVKEIAHSMNKKFLEKN
jgi:hypothetical protein